jgi:hypothetical protein
MESLFGGTQDFAKALSSAARDYGGQAEVLSRSAKVMQSVWNTIEAISGRLRTFFLSVTEQFARPLQKLLDLIKETDLGNIGAEFGKSIADAMEFLMGAFKNGTIFEIMRLGLTVAYETSANWLTEKFTMVSEFVKGTLTNSLIAAYEASIAFLSSAFAAFANSELLPAIGNAIVAGWGFGVSKIMQGIAEVMEYTRAAIIWAAFQAMIAIGTVLKGEFWESAWEGFKNVLSKIKDALIWSFVEALEFLADGFPAAMKKAWEATKNFFSGVTGQMSEVAGASSFSEIKNSQLVRADAARSVAGAAGGIGESAWGKALPVFEKMIGDAATAGGKAGAMALSGAPVFKQATSDAADKLAALLASASATGKKMTASATDDSATMKSTYQADPSRAIADNLAKVGGGGNYIIAGQSLAQRQLAASERSAKANEETNNLLRGTGPSKPPAKPTLPR